MCEHGVSAQGLCMACHAAPGVAYYAGPAWPYAVSKKLFDALMAWRALSPDARREIGLRLYYFTPSFGGDAHRVADALLEAAAVADGAK